jgi:two-component system phosphate regulon response regulator OmpR
MDTRGHLLIVDDDPDVRSTLADYFQAHGFAISTAGDGAEMRAALCGNPVDVVLMDLHLPGEDGLVLTRELRAKGGVGIVMVTGVGETVDRVIGLEMGADDYVAKPFDLRELLARVRSVLRRVRTGQASVPAAPENPKEKVRVGHCTLDLAARKLFGLDGEEIALSAAEFDLLEVFVANPNRVLSRERLLDLAHGRADEVFDRSIDVRVARVRKKIEANPDRPEVIKTVRGAGYMFVPSRRA